MAASSNQRFPLENQVPGELRDRLRILRERYGRQSFTSPAERLEVAASRRRYLLRELRRQISELEERVAIIESELAGYGRGATALVEEEVRGYEQRFPEAWSPTAVTGYRIWALKDDYLVGARHIWSEPCYRASCDQTTNEGEIPHTDERCGRLGCGIYASKSLEQLLEVNLYESSREYAAALVGLTGKVVEHEDGYRAASAEVMALTLIGADRQVFTRDRSIIGEAYANPRQVLASDAACRLRKPVLPNVISYLTERIDLPWISVNANE